MNEATKSCELSVHDSALEFRKSKKPRVGAQSANDGIPTTAIDPKTGICVENPAGSTKIKTGTRAQSQSLSFDFGQNQSFGEFAIPSAGTASEAGWEVGEAAGAVDSGDGGERPPDPTLGINVCATSHAARPPGLQVHLTVGL